MVKIALNIPIIIIKVNEINSPMKRQRLSDIFKKNPGHTDKPHRKIVINVEKVMSCKY